jgi:hypothetical protein
LVDIDLCAPLHLYWYAPERWTGVVGARSLGAEECQGVAVAFASLHCPYVDPTAEPVRVEQVTHDGAPCYRFAWNGTGPENRDNWLDITVSAQTGAVGEYGFGMRAPQPEATSEIRISEQQAADIVRRSLPPNVQPRRVELVHLWTRTVYARPGTPVYVFEVEGTCSVPLEGRPDGQAWYGTLVGVNATTGEFLDSQWRAEDA